MQIGPLGDFLQLRVADGFVRELPTEGRGDRLGHQPGEISRENQFRDEVFQPEEFGGMC